MKELYLNNQLCDIDEDFNPTFQFKSFLFSKMQGYEAPRTWETSIPLTAKNRAIIYQSQTVDSTSTFPYITHSVSYYSDGYPVVENGKSYVINVAGGRANLVFVIGTTIEVLKSLSEVKLNELTETAGDYLTWDRDIDLSTPLTGVDFGWANWYSYTNEDRSLVGANADLPFSTLHPVVKLGWLIRKIQTEFGITINGLSAVEEYVMPIKRVDGISTLTQSEIEYDLEIYEYLNEFSVGLTDVVLAVEEPLSATFASNTGRRIRLTSSVFTDFPQEVRIHGVLNVEMKFHGISTDLYIWINGGTSSAVGTVTKTDMSTYWMYEFDVVAELGANDFFTINFEGTNIANILAGSYVKSELPAFKNKSLYLKNFFIVPNLPELTCSEFLNQCSMLTGKFPYVDELVPNVINFYSTKILYDTPAQDWSRYLLKESDTMGQAEDMAFTIDGFSQRNQMKYADDETNTLDTSGVLQVDNTNIEIESDLFEMFFGAAKRFSTTNIADYPLYDIRISDGKLFKSVKNQNLNVIGSYNNVGGVNQLIFPDSMKYSAIKSIEPYQYYQAVIQKPKVLRERFALTARLLSLIDVRIPIYIEQYGQYFAILEAQVNDNYEADVTILQLPVITPITSTFYFEAYDDTNVTYFLNSVAIDPAGESFEFDLEDEITITATTEVGFVASLYVKIGTGSESLYYPPFNAVVGVENISIRGQITESTPVTSDVVFEPYSWLNGAFSFKGMTIAQGGQTFTTLRGTQAIISGVANKGFTATLQIDKGLGPVSVSLPYTLNVDVAEITCIPAITADSTTEDKTITIAAYDEPFGIVYIKIDDVDYPVSPAGATFTLTHGQYFYLYIVPISGYTTSINLGGGVVINEEYYEDILITNMSFAVTFIAESVPSTKRLLTVSAYDGSKGGLVVYIPSVVTHYVPAAGGVYEFNQGDRLFFSISPATGFEIDQLIIDGVSVPVPFNSYDTYINSNMNVGLTFKAATSPPEENYYLEIYDQNFNTDIYVNGILAEGFSFDEYLPSGSTVTVHLIPKEGFIISSIHEKLENVFITQNPFVLSIDKARSISSITIPKPTGTLYTRYVHYPIKS